MIWNSECSLALSLLKRKENEYRISYEKLDNNYKTVELKHLGSKTSETSQCL